jgi:hypothetical protein
VKFFMRSQPKFSVGEAVFYSYYGREAFEAVVVSVNDRRKDKYVVQVFLNGKPEYFRACDESEIYKNPGGKSQSGKASEGL